MTALVISPAALRRGGADRDIGGAQLAAAEQFQRHAALAAVFPFRGIGQIVFAAQLEVRDLVIFLQSVMLHPAKSAA